MEKFPIVIITGAPHSYSSMLTQLLLNNGMKTTHTDNTLSKGKYETLECKILNDYAQARYHKRKLPNLKTFLESLETDIHWVLKSPMIGRYLPEVARMTQREIRIIYTHRDIKNTIISCTEKHGHNFAAYFDWLHSCYIGVIRSRFPLEMVAMELVLRKDMPTIVGILSFCGIEVYPAGQPRMQIDTSSIRSHVKSYNMPTADLIYPD